MQFKKNFVFFVLAAVIASASAIPLPGSVDLVSATNDLVNVVDFPVRGRSPVKVEVRDPRHGGDSGSRGRGDSRNRRDVSSCLHYPTSWSRLIQTSFNQLEARRHGSGSRGRGDSRGRRDLEARRHGSGSRGRGNSHTRRDLEARRHGSGSRGRGDSRDRRDLEARRHGSGSRGRGDSRNRRGLEARRHGSGSRNRGDSRDRK
ncbi:hypothetical protein OH76DRAFT_661961 [Lentinus brumalis]|uniref:Uncharacterized protein n=1 Tax=Lentinus brumalis TaxID=2498619 RepID=A0A371D7R2_9APHY|nr:hypothetical protein OH76DRAFT_661961 [Polyporus brumalis]